MNIFILSKDPKKAAQLQVNKHVVKMVTETAQILSTCHRVLESPYAESVYRKTHTNHPCCIWTRQSRQNYEWLYNHFLALLDEYTFRYQKTHACTKLVEILKNNPVKNNSGLTPFALAMPDQYKVACPVQSYKNYYINEKYHIFAWKNRKTPDWALKFDK